jgi:predicted Zn-dependent protease
MPLPTRATALLLATGLAAATGLASALDLDGLGLDTLLGAGEKLVTALRDISPAEEALIGRGMAAGLLGAAPLLDDPAAQRYVNQVGRWCALQSGRPGMDWHFAVLDDPDVNAFAAPGGYVFVTRGLLGIAGSEAELAGVLAHEIGHVVARHHVEALRAQAARGLLGDIAGRALGGRVFDASPFISGGLGLLARGLDREDEFEADRLGVTIATRAGYEPYGLPRVLLRIGQMGPRAQGLELLTSTHPPATERLARLERLMRGRFDRFGGQPLLEQRYREHLAHLFAR